MFHSKDGVDNYLLNICDLVCRTSRRHIPANDLFYIWVSHRTTNTTLRRLSVQVACKLPAFLFSFWANRQWSFPAFSAILASVCY
jgi:hypothetical protein